MDKFLGTSINKGLSRGKLYLFSHDECSVRRYRIESSYDEIRRFEKAKTEAISELQRLFYKTSEEINEEEALIFSTQLAMLEDDSYNDSVLDIITDQMINAEVAVALTCDVIVQQLEEGEDDFIGTHSYDIKDISERIIKILLGMQRSEILSEEPVIIVAKDLPASDIVQFDKNKILGIVVEDGNANIHAAKLAVTMGFPAIIGTGSIMGQLTHGGFAVLNGDEGYLEV